MLRKSRTLSERSFCEDCDLLCSLRGCESMGKRLSALLTPVKTVGISRSSTGGLSSSMTPGLQVLVTMASLV
jgi:hypothetical protein